MKAGLYARISTHDRQTLLQQSGAMREYVARRRWEIALEVYDVGVRTRHPAGQGQSGHRAGFFLALVV